MVSASALFPDLFRLNESLPCVLMQSLFLGSLVLDNYCEKTQIEILKYLVEDFPLAKPDSDLRDHFSSAQDKYLFNSTYLFDHGQIHWFIEFEDDHDTEGKRMIRIKATGIDRLRALSA